MSNVLFNYYKYLCLSCLLVIVKYGPFSIKTENFLCVLACNLHDNGVWGTESVVFEK